MSKILDSTSDLEIIVAQLATDPHIRAKVGSYLESWMFGRVAVRAYLATLLSSANITRTLPQNILLAQIKQGNPKLQKEDWEIIIEVMKADPVTEADHAAVLTIISEFVVDRLKMRAYNTYAEGKKADADQWMMRAMGFRIDEDMFFDPTDRKQILYYKEQSLPPEGGVLRSSIALINEVSMFGGYKPGDLVMVLAAPKRGKSSYFCQEGATLASHGARVAHFVYGDMDHYDVWSKYVAILNNTSISNAAFHPLDFIGPVEETMSRVRIASFPALSKTIYDVINDFKSLHRQFPFDAFVVDYDGNIIQAHENMYESGGIIYALLKGFAQSYRLVGFIGSQPKQNFWNDEDVAGSAAAESSKKQHVIDYMIALGRNQKAKRLGMIHLPFVRRGESMVKRYLEFDDAKSTVKEVTGDQYRRILSEVESEKSETGDIIL